MKMKSTDFSPNVVGKCLALAHRFCLDRWDVIWHEDLSQVEFLYSDGYGNSQS